ncbi:MAG: cytochrome-c peroxidase [Acidobacteria bacterium]|nr:cytochrome-c peroxidase [Acidobacteriota bacterium]
MTRKQLRFLIILAFVLAIFVLITPSFNALQRPFYDVIPLGLPEDTWTYYVPKNNPLTAAKVELGRKLFFDARLSADGKVSCSTCHDPKLAFTDGKTIAEGIAGRRGVRNSPTLFNILFNPAQFWDGRTDTLEQQAVEPLINPLEMGNASHDEVINRLRAVADYRADFHSVFGGEITIERLAQAIAAFERALVSADSPLDRFVAGDEEAISPEARRGFAIFRGRGRCSRCHTFSEQRPFFTNFGYQNTGVAASHPAYDKLARQAAAAVETDQAKAVIDKLGKEEGGQELGRILVSYQLFELGSYRTPSLRNVALTAPYFHNGSAKTLAEVVKFYNGGGRLNLNLDEELHALGLTEDEQRDLVAFLESLTGKNLERENTKQTK